MQRNSDCDIRKFLDINCTVSDAEHTEEGYVTKRSSVDKIMLKYTKSENSNVNKHFNNPEPLCTQMHVPGPHQLALTTNLPSSEPNHKSSLHFEDT